MDIFSYHLVKTTPAQTLHTLRYPPSTRTIPGLYHAECMAVMTLGAPILSLARMQMRHLAVFASWESEDALDHYLNSPDLGHILATGWHLRLKLRRRWGRFPEFDERPEYSGGDATQPVVAVTLARLKLPEVFRFIRWGRPVEKLVRDHPGTTLALAAFRPPRTFSTFSVWRSQKAMSEMVHGLGSTPGAKHHAAAMKERDRKDFHHTFTTLRFQPLSEHGEWDGRKNIVLKP